MRAKHTTSVGDSCDAFSASSTDVDASMSGRETVARSSSGCVSTDGDGSVFKSCNFDTDSCAGTGTSNGLADGAVKSEM